MTLSEGAGTRTLDLRIKSPLLYRLSYAFVRWSVARQVAAATIRSNGIFG